MKQEIPSKPPYRRVVADLLDCEERHTALLKSLDITAGSEIASGLAKIRKEVRERRKLEAKLLTAVERERERIGQDLHDDLCQRLGGLALLLGSLAKQATTKDPTLGAKLSELPHLVESTIDSCRDLARGLHPITLSKSGLPAALKELAERLPEEITLACPEGKRILFEPETALHLYRIAEEAVGNAVKHGASKNITIALDVQGGRAVLVIRDDGTGFAKRNSPEGMGLRNMKYRANVIGARLTIKRTKPRGTEVRCSSPVNTSL